ncbi:O-antigen translocase [Photobacterium carnosum]|uniref:O-antigen translocase n=1 Tax=Photobacterium carnosum TaxID=2023717 RepID=UPI0024307665|nr:O-antigen translocase [Photobacterium carnosum]
MKKLLSVTGFMALLTLMKMISGFLIAKFVAIYAGPTGMAMLGQIQSIVTSFSGIVNAPVSSGLIRYTSENIDYGYNKCAPWWKASLQWALGILLIFIPLGILFSSNLSIWLFDKDEYYWIIIVVCLTLPLNVINTLISSVINGQQKYKKYVLLGMISTVISTLIMLYFIYAYNIRGALIAASINYSLYGVVMLISSVREPWFKFKYWFGSLEKYHLKKIGGYVIMAITSALTVPLSLIIIRNLLVDNFGWDNTGQWQAVWKISEVYLSIITISLSTYYLPRLSKLKNIKEIRTEINKTTIIIIPIVILSALFIYIFRDFAISVLFTDKFKTARDLFAIQLCGDVIKILSWIYAYPMISRGATKLFVTSEILFAITFIVFTYYFIGVYGIKGVNIAYLVNYILYFIFVFCNLKKM